MLFEKPYAERGPVFRIKFAKEPFRNALQEVGRKDRSRSKISHRFARGYRTSGGERFLPRHRPPRISLQAMAAPSISRRQPMTIPRPFSFRFDNAVKPTRWPLEADLNFPHSILVVDC